MNDTPLTFIHAMNQLWQGRYPHAPWLTICWQKLQMRMSAGDDYVLFIDQADDDHAPPWGVSANLSQDIPFFILSWSVAQAINSEDEYCKLWQENGSLPWVMVVDDRQSTPHYRLYAAGTFRDEVTINAWIHKLLITTRPFISEKNIEFPNINPSHWIWQEDQQRAIQAAHLTPLLLLTGGPGSGKTTVLTQILANILAQGENPEKIAVVAPSGKAADRINSAITSRNLDCLQATTVDRLLGLGYGKTPRYHAHNPLPYRWIVVDECSMVSVRRFAQLFRALSQSADHPTSLILCGDPFQLAAVEHGEVFRRLIHWGQTLENTRFQVSMPSNLPVTVSLKGNQRARHKDLLLAAELIQAGEQEPFLAWWQSLPTYISTEPLSEGLFSAVSPMTEAFSSLKSLYLEKVMAVSPNAPPPYDLWSFWISHRILCAQNVGQGGTQAINAQWVKWLSPSYYQTASSNTRAVDDSRPFLINGGVVLLRRNFPAWGLSNGATGIIWKNQVWFPDQLHHEHGRSAPALQALPPSILSSCSWGFAINVHQSQGSEFEFVWLFLPTHARVLSREVLYTGATRAQKTLVLFAEASTLIQALSRRETRLCAVGEQSLVH